MPAPPFAQGGCPRVTAEEAEGRCGPPGQARRGARCPEEGVISVFEVFRFSWLKL